ncbi:MAG: Omp28-related outer membrane protein [Ignavibacteria bacterium]|nr:Omp28-related outer membrane protein [Ignavibacteria bacterium]
MKKIISIFVIAVLISGASFLKVNAQTDTNNVLLEVCTGTWCQWCPCGHVIVESVLQYFPNTLVLEYHGYAGTGDPWVNFNGNGILSQLGYSGYPSGVVGRYTGAIDRGAWLVQTMNQAGWDPSVRIQLVKSYNESTRQLVLTANVTSLRDLDTNVNISFVMLEDNLIYSQTGNGSCTGGSSYVHKHVVRDMVDGSAGVSLSTGHWAGNTVKSHTWTYNVSSLWVAANCQIGVFAYFLGSPLSTSANVLNTKKMGLTAVTGINSQTEIANGYSLSQNYPNPFNPSTNFKFSIPKNTNVSLKIYDALGKEIENYYDGFMDAGTYNVTFDGSKLASGIYFYKLQTKDFSDIKKMMIVK